jgi:hypothetical protein
LLPLVLVLLSFLRMKAVAPFVAKTTTALLE